MWLLESLAQCVEHIWARKLQRVPIGPKSRGPAPPCSKAPPLLGVSGAGHGPLVGIVDNHRKVVRVPTTRAPCDLDHGKRGFGTLFEARHVAASLVREKKTHSVFFLQKKGTKNGEFAQAPAPGCLGGRGGVPLGGSPPGLEHLGVSSGVRGGRVLHVLPGRFLDSQTCTWGGGLGS